MTLTKPTELADVVAKLDTAEAQLKEFETIKTQVETLTKSLEELNNQLTGLQDENKDLKQQLADSDTARESFEEENKTLKAAAEQVEAKTKEKLTELSDAELSTLAAPDGAVDIKSVSTEAAVGTDIAQLQAQIEELKSRLDATEEVAVEAEEAKEEVKEQIALVAAHLMPKGAVPDIEEAGDAGKVPDSYKSWLKLANSKNPEDRRAARLLKAANPEIAVQINKGTQTAPVAPQTVSSLSAEQISIFNQWKSLLQEAKSNESALNGKAPTERHRAHVQATVDARALYKKNKSAIDACLAAQ